MMPFVRYLHAYREVLLPSYILTLSFQTFYWAAISRTRDSASTMDTCDLMIVYQELNMRNS